MATLSKDSVAGLLTSGEHADFSVVCDGRKFALHKMIVFPQSAYLRDKCKSQKEGKTGEFVFIYNDAATFTRAVNFFYRNDYDDCPVALLGDAVPSEVIPRDIHVHSEPEASLPDSLRQPRRNLNIGAVELQPISPPSIPDSSTAYIWTSSPPSKTQSKLKTNFLVYACAQVLQVKSLQNLAMEKFRAEAAIAYTNPEKQKAFFETARHILRSTAPSSIGLRVELLRICVDNAHHVKLDHDLIWLLQEHEPIAWMTMNEFKAKDLASRYQERGDEALRVEVARSRQIAKDQLKNKITELEAAACTKDAMHKEKMEELSKLLATGGQRLSEVHQAMKKAQEGEAIHKRDIDLATKNMSMATVSHLQEIERLKKKTNGAAAASPGNQEEVETLKRNLAEQRARLNAITSQLTASRNRYHGLMTTNASLSEKITEMKGAFDRARFWLNDVQRCYPGCGRAWRVNMRHSDYTRIYFECDYCGDQDGPDE